MADTFAYDLVSFLRVLYQRRWFIAKGTAAVTVLVMIISLIWPQTWRADARVLVTTPKYKLTLRLIPQPFDVLTYRGIMTSDSLYREIIDTVKWYKPALAQLLTEENKQKMKANLPGKAERLNDLQLIDNTNEKMYAKLLTQPPDLSSDLWYGRLLALGRLSDKEMAAIQNMSDSELDDITVFDLRKTLHASVTVVKETNMETVYSNLISVAAESDTADNSRMMANTWIAMFLGRAEEIVKNSVKQQIMYTRERAAAQEIELVSAESEITAFKNDAQLNSLRAQTASQLVALTGVTPIQKTENRTDESFNLEDQNEPFMKERREQYDSMSYSITQQYDKALITQKLECEKALAGLNSLLTIQNPEQKSAVEQQLKEFNAKLLGLNQQIKSVENDVRKNMIDIREREAKIDSLERKKVQLLSSLKSMQPLLDEASLLESKKDDTRYADVGNDWAIKPDKRLSPKRSIMTIAGFGLSFILFCGFAFFLDIWKEVIKPEESKN